MRVQGGVLAQACVAQHCLVNISQTDRMPRNSRALHRTHDAQSPDAASHATQGWVGACRQVERTVCMIFRTRVTLSPRVTRVSAIQPPTLLVTAMVIHGSTLKMPLFIRSKCSTCACAYGVSNRKVAQELLHVQPLASQIAESRTGVIHLTAEHKRCR